MLDIHEPLALVAPFYELPCISLHGKPEVTYSDDPTYQGSRAYVVYIYSFVDLLQNILRFIFFDTL